MNAIVTGATKGIGRAIVEKLAAEGANIAFCARTNADLENMLLELQGQYPNQTFLAKAVDMSQVGEVKDFATVVKASWEQIHLLVNNAGVFIPGQIHEEEEGALEKMITTNLYSAYHLTRALLPQMLPQKAGHIFNICSIASIFAYPNGGSYSISKFALLGFSKVLREEMKPHNINVTSILPGATLTDSWSGVDLPPERFSRAEDVAEALWSAYQVGDRTCIEEILLRPKLGDI